MYSIFLKARSSRDDAVGAAAALPAAATES